MPNMRIAWIILVILLPALSLCSWACGDDEIRNILPNPVITANQTTTTPTTVDPSIPDYCGPGARQLFSFEEIISLLDTPEKLSLFMSNNIEFDGGFDNESEGGNEYVPARIVYERGVDDSDGHAILQAYILERNGWDAYMIGIAIERPDGFNVAGVNMPDGKILVLGVKGSYKGMFNSLSEIVQTCVQAGSLSPEASIRTIRASMIQGNVTGEVVLRIPWTRHVSEE